MPDPDDPRPRRSCSEPDDVPLPSVEPAASASESAASKAVPEALVADDDAPPVVLPDTACAGSATSDWIWAIRWLMVEIASMLTA